MSSFAFGWIIRDEPVRFTERQLLDFAADHGARVVQFGDNMPLHALSDARVGALASAAAVAGVRLEAGARGLTDARLARYLAVCGAIGSRMLRFVIDEDGYEPTPEDVVTLLRNAEGELARAGVTIGLENHDRFAAAQLRGIVDAVGSRCVGVCLDTANSFGAGEGLEYVTHVLAPVTVNLHVKDVAITRLTHQMGFLIEGRRLGRGQLPIRSTLARVLAEGRCASAILEGWTRPLPSRAATHEAERLAAVDGIAQLKAWLDQLKVGSDGCTTAGSGRGAT